MFYVYQLPVPRLTSSDPRFAPIASRGARLICTTPEFDELAQAVGLAGYEDGATDPEERARLRAELDGLVAHLYGLTEAEFEHVLSTFPLVAAGVKAAALEQYRTLAPRPGDPEVARLVAAGESVRLEFKSTARWDVRQGVQSKEMEKVIVKTVAAFMNSEGGDLLIGVADDGSVYGLEADYRTLGARGDADGFEQFLTQLLGNALGFGLAPLVRVSFHPLEGKTVCKVSVKPSPSPVWAKLEGGEQFFVRTNNSSRPLSGREAQEYDRRRWG